MLLLRHVIVLLVLWKLKDFPLIRWPDENADMLDLGHFPGLFQAYSELIPSLFRAYSELIPNLFRAYSAHNPTLQGHRWIEVSLQKPEQIQAKTLVRNHL